MNTIKLIQGDCLSTLKTLPPESVHCVVTSPPYWGLRDYNVEGQIGLEPSFDEFLAQLVAVFDEVKRVLHPSGTIWVNMGDSSNSDRTRGAWGDMSTHGYTEHGNKRTRVRGLHPKNVIGQPWRLAFALQAAKWILRRPIIWHKLNPMPSSVDDVPTPSHEYVFLLSKAPIYYFDWWGVREPTARQCVSDFGGKKWKDVEINPGDPNYRAGSEQWKRTHVTRDYRRLRDVWPIPTQGVPDAHFATFPEALVEPCIKAGHTIKGNWAPVVRTLARS